MDESAELTLAEIKMLLAMPDDNIPEELVKDHDAPPDEKNKLSIYQMIQGMSTGPKIKLALKGNKEARGILVKDSNKWDITVFISSSSPQYSGHLCKYPRP